MKREKVSFHSRIIIIVVIIIIPLLVTLCQILVPVTATGHPVRCSICSSAPNREGLECIENPKKFSRDCNTGPRKNESEYKEFKGCWKIEQFVLYDGPEPFNKNHYNTSGLENKPRDDDKSIESIERALRKRHHRIIRSCAYHGGIDGSCINRGSSGWSQIVCWCKKESCNKTILLYPSSFITFVTFILFYFLHNNFTS